MISSPTTAAQSAIGRLYLAASRLIATDGWTKGSMHSPGVGYCAAGAVREVYDHAGFDAGACVSMLGPLANYLLATDRQLGTDGRLSALNDPCHVVTTWNDHHARDADAVRAALTGAAHAHAKALSAPIYNSASTNVPPRALVAV